MTLTAPPGTQHLTPKDLSERMGVPVNTVYDWNAKGTGPRFMRIGRHVRYKLADVIAWEDARYADSGASNGA